MTEPTSKMTEWDELDLPVLTEIAEYPDSAEHAVPELSLEDTLGLPPTPADSLHSPTLPPHTAVVPIPELELELPPDLELDSLLLDGEGSPSVPPPEFSLDHLPSLDLEEAEPEDMRLDELLPQMPPGGLSQASTPSAHPGELDAFVFELVPESEGEPGPSDDRVSSVGIRQSSEDEGAMAVSEALSIEVAPPLAGKLAQFEPEQPLWEALPQDEDWEVAPPGDSAHGEAPLAGEFETASLPPHGEIHPVDWSMGEVPESSGAAVEGKAGWGAEPPTSSASQPVFSTAIDMPVPEALPEPDVVSAHGEAPHPDGDLNFTGAAQEISDGASGSVLSEASVPQPVSSAQMGGAACDAPSMTAEPSLGQIANESEPVVPDLDLSALLGVMDEAHDLDVGEPDVAAAFAPADELPCRSDLDEPATAVSTEPTVKPEQSAEQVEHGAVGELVDAVELLAQPPAGEENLYEPVQVAEAQVHPEARPPVEPEPMPVLPELDVEVGAPLSGSQAAPSVEDQVSTDVTQAPVPNVDTLPEVGGADLPSGSLPTVDEQALTEALRTDDLSEAQDSVLPSQAEELRHQEEVSSKALPSGKPFAAAEEGAEIPAVQDGFSEEALSNEAWFEQKLLNESDAVTLPAAEEALSANAEPEWKEPLAQPAGEPVRARDIPVLTPEAAAAPAPVFPPVQSIDIDSLPQGVLHAPEIPPAFEAVPDPLAALQARLNEIRAQLDQSASEPAVFRMPPQREVASLHEDEKSPAVATPMNGPVHPSAWPASAIAEAESFPEESFPDLASAAESSVAQANTGVAIVGEEKLIESLYQKILPRMKVELGLWLQDALELQSKQLLAGVMQQLKEDYEPMFGETLRESLRQAISEAGGGDAVGHVEGRPK